MSKIRRLKNLSVKWFVFYHIESETNIWSIGGYPVIKLKAKS